MLKLRDLRFPSVLGASGVQGFFGDPEHKEYKHSSLIQLFWGDIFNNMGFVSKTATVKPNKGNVKLAKNGFAFKEFMPNAIYPMFFKKAALNAVGLSNPGFEFLLDKGYWQERREPFMLSFMSIAGTPSERITEVEMFTQLLMKHLSSFHSRFAIQVNLSCPNTGHKQEELVGEAKIFLETLGDLGLPLVPKISALLNPSIADTILAHKECDALCISNTIPFGELPNKINWKKYSDGKYSPLEKHNYPKGGLSGAPLFPILVDWLTEFTELSQTGKPLIAGGGIMSKDDLFPLSKFPQVKAVSLGSVGFLRPWKVPGIIKISEDIFH